MREVKIAQVPLQQECKAKFLALQIKPCTVVVDDFNYCKNIHQHVIVMICALLLHICSRIVACKGSRCDYSIFV